MSNMAYCRFRNTLEDLWDCYENLDETNLSEYEELAKGKLIKLCKKIVDNWYDEEL